MTKKYKSFFESHLAVLCKTLVYLYSKTSIDDRGFLVVKKIGEVQSTKRRGRKGFLFG